MRRTNIEKDSRFQTHLSLFSEEKKRKNYQKYLRFFQKRKKQVFHLFLYQKILLVFFVFLFGSILIFFSPLFQVSEILISRKDPVSNIEQAYRSVDIYRKKNIIFLNGGDIAKRIYNGQKSLKNIQVKKNFPKTLEISLESFQPLFITENSYILENGSIIPNDGTVIESLAYLELPKYISKEEKLNFEELEQIKDFEELLKKNILGTEIEYIKLFPKEQELLVGIQGMRLIIIDLQKDLLAQIEKLSIYHNDKANILETPYVYIDLRIDGKIFLCPKSAEQNCNANILEMYETDISQILQQKTVSQTQL